MVYKMKKGTTTMSNKKVTPTSMPYDPELYRQTCEDKVGRIVSNGPAQGKVLRVTNNNVFHKEGRDIYDRPALEVMVLGPHTKPKVDGVPRGHYKEGLVYLWPLPGWERIGLPAATNA